MGESHETLETKPKYSTPNNGRKATSREIEQRVEQVYSLLVQMVSRKEIVAYGYKMWGVNPRTVDDYIIRARKLIARDSRIKREDELDLARANLDYLYRQFNKIQDYKGCLAVVKARAELLGLNAPAKTEITGANGAPLQVAISAIDYRTILAPLAPDEEEPHE